MSRNSSGFEDAERQDPQYSQEYTKGLVEANRDRIADSIRAAEAEVASDDPLTTLNDVLGVGDDTMTVSFNERHGDNEYEPQLPPPIYSGYQAVEEGRVRFGDVVDDVLDGN